MKTLLFFRCLKDNVKFGTDSLSSGDLFQADGKSLFIAALLDNELIAEVRFIDDEMHDLDHMPEGVASDVGLTMWPCK